jgi:hypothetical protein
VGLGSAVAGWLSAGREAATTPLTAALAPHQAFYIGALLLPSHSFRSIRSA